MQQKELRHKFIHYLKAHYNYAHPEIMASNVFYAWHNNIGMNFWRIFESEQSMNKAKELILIKFKEVGRKDPNGHAAVHYDCWKKFREFLYTNQIQNKKDNELKVCEFSKPKRVTNNTSVNNGDLNLCSVIEKLKIKRRLFHSEADFQFSLAWEIQKQYPQAHVRLEYCLVTAPNMHIDILVEYKGKAYPIELKYKTLELKTQINLEQYHLKSHGAQDIGSYDCLLDLQRTEKYSVELPHFGCGYVLWLTNDPYYWTQSKRNGTMGADFSIHNNAVKTGTMKWASHTGAGTMKGRENTIMLKGTYTICWHDYSKISNDRSGQLRYAMCIIRKGAVSQALQKLIN